MTIELIVVDAMHQVKVVNLVKGESLSVAHGDTIRLTHKADIKTFRKGGDLVIKNASGEEFVLKDFYQKPEGADEGQLFSWDDTEGQEKEILSTEYSEPINTTAVVADAANEQISNEVVKAPAETAAAKEEDDDDDAAALLLASSSEPGMGMLAGIALVGAALLSTSSGSHGGGGSGGAPAPVNNALGAVSDTDAAANIVNDQAANGTPVGVVTLAVDTDAGSTVTYSLVNDAGGRFAINASTGVVTVANGSALDHAAAQSHIIRVLATSSDGTTAQRDFTINVADTTPPATPAAPTSYADNVGTIQNPTSTAVTTDDTTPGINIGAGLTDVPVLYVDGIEVPATYNPTTGTLTPNNPIAEGTHNFTYTLTDPAGNESLPSPALPITVDTTAPATPAAPVNYNDNVGSIQNPVSIAPITDDATPGINIGTGLTDVPSLYVDGVEVPATYNPTTGTLTPNNPIAEGTHNFTYTLTDPAGNESLPSPALPITIDAAVPATPVAPTSYADNVGAIQNPTSTAPVTDDATPGINIGIGHTDVPTLYVDGVEVPATYNPATGTLTPNTPLSEGLHALTYTLTNAGGQESVQSAPLNLTIDTTPPAQVINITGISEDTGVNDNDFITSDNDGLDNRLQRITDQDTLSMILSGQWAANNLNSSEKYSLGGVYGIRAYPQGEASGDMGAMLKLELAHHFTPQLRGTVFYDYGHIRINQDDFSEADNTRTLSGAGLGFNAALAGWQLDSYVAWPLQGGDPLSEPESSVHTPRLWMQMSGDF